MKKKDFLITISIILFQNFYGQVVDIGIEIDKPTRIAVKNNELYFVQEGKISKIDITKSTPSVTDVLTELNEPNGFGLIFNENDLYISQTVDGKISRVDITSNSLILDDILTDLNFPNKFVLDGNDLRLVKVMLLKHLK